MKFGTGVRHWWYFDVICVDFLRCGSWGCGGGAKIVLALLCWPAPAHAGGRGEIRPIDGPFHPSMYVGLYAGPMLVKLTITVSVWHQSTVCMSVWKLPVTVFKLLTQDSVHIIQVHLGKMIFLFFFEFQILKGTFVPFFSLKRWKMALPLLDWCTTWVKMDFL